MKSESGFTSHVQTEEACDGSPFFSFPSLWHPLPSWHKFAPNWHKIVWQNAASHMIWARVPALAAAVSQNAFIEGLAWVHWTTEKIPRNLIRFE